MLKELTLYYDSLIDENNDPFRDPPVLQAYMNKWDGDKFIDALMLDNSKAVLEIGLGTGRIAFKIAPVCKKLAGIDISQKTITRAKENLDEFKNITYICGNFLEYDFVETFDVIYSTLTFMHIEEKQRAIEKIVYLLKPFGRVAISLDKNQNKIIDNGYEKIKVFPDTVQEITKLFLSAGLYIEQIIETEFANIIVATKYEGLLEGL